MPIETSHPVSHPPHQEQSHQEPPGGAVLYHTGYSIWHSAPPLCLRWCPDDRSGCTGCGAGGQGDQHGQPQIFLKHWSTAALYVVIVNIAKLSPNLSPTNLDQVRPNPIFPLIHPSLIRTLQSDAVNAKSEMLSISE